MTFYCPHKSGTRLIICLILLSGTGCISRQMPELLMPDWTIRGNGALHNNGNPVFQSLGSATEMSNASLLRAASDNRAREKLADLLEQYLNDLIKVSGYDNLTPELQQSINTIIRQGLDRARIADHWFNEKEEILYTRCLLDFAEFKHLIASATLPISMRQHLLAEADHVFDTYMSSSPERPQSP